MIYRERRYIYIYREGDIQRRGKKIYLSLERGHIYNFGGDLVFYYSSREKDIHLTPPRALYLA